MKLLTIQGLSRLKQKIDSFFLHKGQDETVTGVKTFGTDPLFDDDKRLIDRLFEGNLIFLDVNDGEHIGSTRVEDISNLYYDINTAPAVEGYDFVTMEYDPLTEKYNLWYIPLTNPVVSTSDEMISYINQGIVPNTKNLTTIEFYINDNTRLNQNVIEVPRFYSKNAAMISFFDSLNSPVKIIHPFDTTSCRDNTQSSSADCSILFQKCTELEVAPFVDLSNLTNFNSIFSKCSKITSIPSYNFSNATNMRGAFAYCSSIEEIPHLETSKCTNFNIIFRECSNLKVVRGLNLANASSTSNMFKDCTSLREVHIDFGNNSNSVLNTLFNGLTFGSNQMINLYVKNIPQSVRTAIENNYSAHVTIIDEV